MKTRLNTLILMLCMIIILVAGSTDFHASAQQKDLNPGELINTNETVTAFIETEKFYWVGTENGVYQVKKKNGKINHLTEKNSDLPSNLVTAICAKSNGDVFIGTTKGILGYSGIAFSVVNTENAAMTSNDITALYCDKDDFLWIGTSSAIYSMIRFVNLKNFNIFSTPVDGDHIVAFEGGYEKEIILIMAGGSRMKFANGRIEKTVNSETAVHAGTKR